MVGGRIWSDLLHNGYISHLYAGDCWHRCRSFYKCREIVRSYAYSWCGRSILSSDGERSCYILLGDPAQYDLLYANFISFDYCGLLSIKKCRERCDKRLSADKNLGYHWL